MNTLLEFLPIIVFFAVYKYVGGIEAVYPATLAAIIAALLTTAWAWFRTRHIERRQLVMLGVLVVLGGLTLALQDARFIKLKPTIVSWLTAAIFLGSQFIGDKPLIERAMAGSMSAPPFAWRRLNLAWVCFFTLTGGLNLFVGPLNLQDGKAYLKEGEKATDQQIWYLPQLLEGMEGQSVPSN